MPLKFWGLEGKLSVKGEVSVVQSHFLLSYFPENLEACVERPHQRERVSSIAPQVFKEMVLLRPSGCDSVVNPALHLYLVLEVYLLRTTEPLVMAGSVSDTVNLNTIAQQEL